MKKIWFVLSFCIISNLCWSYSIHGNAGLFTIPTATIGKDGDFNMGFVNYNKKHFAYTNEKYNAYALTSSFVFLPWAEINVRVLRNQGVPDEFYKTHSADRVPSFKLVRVNKRFPSLALGVNDLMSVFGGTDATHFHCVYLAASKYYNINTLRLGMHAGYGHKAKKNAAHYEFQGPFGGLEFSLNNFKYLNAYLEYDGNRLNYGATLSYKMFSSTLGLKGEDSFNYAFFIKLNAYESLAAAFSNFFE